MKLSEFFPKINRRRFIHILSLAGIGGLFFPKRFLSFNRNSSSTVAVLSNNRVTSGQSINISVVQEMVNSGILTITNEADLSDAWKTLLPNISMEKVIAIKINTLNRNVPTRPEIVYSVANSLQQINIEGSFFPANNIIIFDRLKQELRNAGYTINTSNSGVKCVGTDDLSIGYSTTNYNVEGVNQSLSRVVTDIADYIINISVLKNHNMSGVTLCLKNHYGTCSHPDQLHGNLCNPYIPALNALPPIKNKQCLNIIDALFGISVGGPEGPVQFAGNRIIMSTDIVSADSVGKTILNTNFGCLTTEYATHIETAANDYDLGIADLQDINIIERVITSANESEEDNSYKAHDFKLEQNYPNPFNGATKIKFYISKPTNVKISVYNMLGKQIRILTNQYYSSGWHQLSWDANNKNEQNVSTGLYICRIDTAGKNKSIIMHYLK